MSDFVLLSGEAHRLAVTAELVLRFERGRDGELLPGEPEDADWVVALSDGQRWRTSARPQLAGLAEVHALPPLLARWGADVGVEGWVEAEEGLLLVVGPAFGRREAS